MVVKINTLPDPHVKITWAFSSKKYKVALRETGRHLEKTDKELHHALLQSIYNVHLRAIDHLRKRKMIRFFDRNALPVIAPVNEIISTGVAINAPSLPNEPKVAKALLANLRKEKELGDGHNIVSALIGVSGRGRNGRAMLVINEELIPDAIEQLLRNRQPRELVRSIGRETFLGFAIDTSKHTLTEERSLHDQVKREDNLGARSFQEQFAKEIEGHFDEDFTPLLKILKRK